MPDQPDVGVTLGVAAAVEAALRGDAAGWDRLFERFYGTVHRYAMARTGDPGAAEEVAQEVFVSAVTSIRRLRERSEPGVEGWFLRIARFKIADRARRMARDARAHGAVPPADDPADLAARRLEAAAVRAAMEGLTEDQRDVLVRRFVLDQSLDHVAAATGRAVGAVKALQHRALAALGRRLAEQAR